MNRYLKAPVDNQYVRSLLASLGTIRHHGWTTIDFHISTGR